MIVRNADGSRPEMCGNGLRCVAGHLAASPAGGALVVATDAGDKRLRDRARSTTAASTSPSTWAPPPRRRPRGPLGGPRAPLPHGRHGQPARDHLRGRTTTRVVDTPGPAVATLPAGGTNVEFCRAARARVGSPSGSAASAARSPAAPVPARSRRAACDTGRARFGEPIGSCSPAAISSITVARRTRARAHARAGAPRLHGRGGDLRELASGVDRPGDRLRFSARAYAGLAHAGPRLNVLAIVSDGARDLFPKVVTPTASSSRATSPRASPSPRRTPPDVAFVEIGMGDGAGLALVHHLKAVVPAVTVYALSSRGRSRRRPTPSRLALEDNLGAVERTVDMIVQGVEEGELSTLCRRNSRSCGRSRAC